MSLKAQGIGFRYGNQPWLFRDVSIELHPGEIVGLLGASGTGKTTFARILSSYERPQEGEVTLFGAPPPQRGYHPVQLVFQHPEKALNPRWRLRDSLYEAGEADPGVLEDLGIRREWLTRWPGELSGGELQRFCIARALRPETKFLIADEMTTMLDAVTQAQLWQVVVRQAEERNLGVLVISHDPNLLGRLCHRYIRLQ